MSGNNIGGPSPNTTTIGPLAIGTKPFLHWLLRLPSGLRLMRTPVGTTLYRVAAAEPNQLRSLPFSQRCYRRWGNAQL